MRMHFQKILFCGAGIIGFFAILWMGVCFLLEEKVPNSLIPRADEDYVFDYVVVGAGTAGSVVSSLLAKHSNATVLLIEAGEKFGFFSKIPLLTTFQQGSLNDWGFLSVPQKHSSRGLVDERQSLPRGKGLGGSAQLNYMLHYDGHPEDFDRWASEYNLTEWRWNLVRPFLEASRIKAHESLEISNQYSKLTKAIHDAESEFMHKSWNFRRAKYNIKNGLRYSVLHRFLQPAFKHRNLRIMTNALGKKIHLTSSSRGTKVAALEIGIKDIHTRKEQKFNVEIRKELILSAGAFQTPQLLLASGIGAAKQLEKLNIPQQHEMPQVGKNLHDHFNVPLFVSIDVVGPTINQNALLDPYGIFNYLTAGTGHLGNFGVLGHVDAHAEGFGLTLFGVGAIDESALMSISNFKRAHFRALFPRYHNSSQEGFVIISTCLQPKSRGTVHIRGESMRKNPVIDTNYLHEVSDVNCTLRAMRAAVELVAKSAAFQELKPRILWPKIKECADFGPFEKDFRANEPSDQYLECVMRYIGLTGHHPGGTCTMGINSENSVVDGQLRVHGIENMRIIDASILPTPISGNPNSIVVGMAVRGATMILRDQMKYEKKST